MCEGRGKEGGREGRKGWARGKLEGSWKSGFREGC